jgi:hypothetical protein
MAAQDGGSTDNTDHLAFLGKSWERDEIVQLEKDGLRDFQDRYNRLIKEGRLGGAVLGCIPNAREKLNGHEPRFLVGRRPWISNDTLMDTLQYFVCVVPEVGPDEPPSDPIGEVIVFTLTNGMEGKYPRKEFTPADRQMVGRVANTLEELCVSNVLTGLTSDFLAIDPALVR